ncbi:MAG: hypothetical protein ACE5GH_00270, partial [Fidelibacterota bacterium]
MSTFISARESIPLWSLSLLFTGLVLLAYMVYRTRERGLRKGYSVPFFFRAATFLAITVVLGDLGLSWTSVRVKRPLIRVFFDNSVSAAYHQSISNESLINGYRDIASTLRSAAREFSGGARVSLYSFGSAVGEIHEDEFHLDFLEPATNLSAVLETVNDIPPDQYLAGVVIATDGQVTMGSDPRERARDLHVPVHTIGIGELTPMVDVRIEKVEVPTVGIRGSTAAAEVFISSIGTFTERAQVTLSRAGKLQGSKVVTLAGQGSRKTIRFRFGLEEPGSHLYTVQVSSLQDEINIANNRASFTITTLKHRFRVALITGAPSPNTSFIRRVLRKKGHFQVDHFMKLSRTWSPDMALFWERDYDLIILDNVSVGMLPERWAANLKRKLERHPSGLALIPGANVTDQEEWVFYPLFGLRPLEETFEKDTDYPVRFLYGSDSHPILGGMGPSSRPLPRDISLPPLRPLLFAEPASSEIEVLAYLDGPRPVPLLTAGVLRYPRGEGSLRAVAFTSGELWQLHFRMMSTGYAEFTEQWWRRTYNWLVKSTGEEDIYFRLNKHTYQQGETVYVSGSVLDLERSQARGGEVTMIIEDAGGEVSRFAHDRSER